MDTEHQISPPAFSEAEIMFLFLALTGVAPSTPDELCMLVESNFKDMQDSQVYPAFDTQQLLQRLALLTPAQCRALCFRLEQMNALP